MKLEYILMGAVFVVLFIAVEINYCINKKKGRNGEDKRRIQKIAAEMLDNASFYTVVYANYQTGGPMITRYASYIVAFRPMELFVIPIQFSEKEIIPGKGFFLDQKNVGGVDFSEKPWITFLGKNGERLCTFGVFADNTSCSQFEPLNIQQKEEVERFQAFLRQFAKTLSAGI